MCACRDRLVLLLLVCGVVVVVVFFCRYRVAGEIPSILDQPTQLTRRDLSAWLNTQHTLRRQEGLVK